MYSHLSCLRLVQDLGYKVLSRPCLEMDHSAPVTDLALSRVNVSFLGGRAGPVQNQNQQSVHKAGKVGHRSCHSAIIS